MCILPSPRDVWDQIMSLVFSLLLRQSSSSKETTQPVLNCNVSCPGHVLLCISMHQLCWHAAKIQVILFEASTKIPNIPRNKIGIWQVLSRAVRTVTFRQFISTIRYSDHGCNPKPQGHNPYHVGLQLSVLCFDLSPWSIWMGRFASCTIGGYGMLWVHVWSAGQPEIKQVTKRYTKIPSCKLT